MTKPPISTSAPVWTWLRVERFVRRALEASPPTSYTSTSPTPVVPPTPLTIAV